MTLISNKMGAPLHYSRAVRKNLHVTFPEKWISHREHGHFTFYLNGYFSFWEYTRTRLIFENHKMSVIWKTSYIS